MVKHLWHCFKPVLISSGFIEATCMQALITYILSSVVFFLKPDFTRKPILNIWTVLQNGNIKYKLTIFAQCKGYFFWMVSFVSSGNPGIMIPDSEFSYWLCIETMWLLKKKSLKDDIWTPSDSIIVINCDMHTFFPCWWLLLCCSGWFEYWRQIA